MFSPLEAAEEVERLSRLLANGIAELRKQSELLAEAESEYRKGKAIAWLSCPKYRSDGDKVQAAEREAWVDGETADLRKARDLAEGLRQAALEAVRSRRTQLSALQSLMAANRAEAEFARTGPGGNA